ncbi:uncharacterized protein LOC121373063 [Gigantopelta aegis]|uniref:uncharacterized protein LOC121373063 n=1 Tax=Gigantopelta aegis TaxID=1735272 RepID=UPI001B887B1D|nr:uncharacterized protein LOC121373063 [Gigantopelta aegis]
MNDENDDVLSDVINSCPHQDATTTTSVTFRARGDVVPLAMPKVLRHVTEEKTNNKNNNNDNFKKQSQYVDDIGIKIETMESSGIPLLTCHKHVGGNQHYASVKTRSTVADVDVDEIGSKWVQHMGAEPGGERLAADFGTFARTPDCQTMCDRRSLCKSVKYNSRTREYLSNWGKVWGHCWPCHSIAVVLLEVGINDPCTVNTGIVVLKNKMSTHSPSKRDHKGYINCGEPPVVPNATMSKNGTKFNSGAKYSCDVGYVMSNGTMTSSTCESTGIWTSVKMSCTEIDCGEPPNILHARMTRNGTTFNSVANYSCDVGYAMLNGTTLTCGANGRWTSAKSRCVVDCGAPRIIANGNIVCEATTVGSTGQVECTELFRFFGNDSSTKCDSTGQWLGPSGDCLQVKWTNEMTSFDKNLPDTLSDGWQMFLHGTPISPNKHFSVNLKDHRDRYHMHMDVKFNSGEAREVIFDTNLNNKWGTTIVQTQGFPFRENVPFELILTIQAHEIQIIVDDKAFYNVSLISRVEDITRVHIMGDVAIHQLMLIYEDA